MQKIYKFKKNIPKQYVEFEQNHKVNLICGYQDEIIQYLEEKFTVDITVRSNQISISGDENECQKTIFVLKKLYNNANEKMLDITEVDIAINATKYTKNNVNRVIITTPCKNIQAKTLNQEKYINAIENNTIVFGTGVAGTGKTYIAIACAAMLLTKKLVEKIILSRPAVCAGEKLGFLPGDIREKVDPYIKPLLDGLEETLGASFTQKAIDRGVIEILPLAYMRGRTLANAFIILDEAQNATEVQIKMFLSRLGKNSKMVINGDTSQSDLHEKQNVLAEIIRKISDIDQIESVKFSLQDVVRHHLVAKIIQKLQSNG